jgi:NAD(P)-dependent dehydrogenase (short-subunit alcohol dehydrogenase family)
VVHLSCILATVGGHQQARACSVNCTTTQIITTGSIGAFDRVFSGETAYSASKAGVHHLMKMMSTLLGKFSIQCNFIAPGTFYTEMTSQPFEMLWWCEEGVLVRLLGRGEGRRESAVPWYSEISNAKGSNWGSVQTNSQCHLGVHACFSSSSVSSGYLSSSYGGLSSIT